MHTSTTEKTITNMFVKEDNDLGLLVYSPYTALMYAVHPSEAMDVKKWLIAPKTISAPSDIYEYSLGAGWAVSTEQARHVIPHLLPDQDKWSILPTPQTPILINWLITGRCPLGCLYCYAEDLMRNDEREPKANDINKTGQTILDLNPLVVVLTGGDPLFSPFLPEAIRLLSPHVGVIVDTSGYTLTNKHIELFKKYKVAVRISIDSERLKINQAQRPLYSGYPKLQKTGIPTAEASLNAICRCLDAGICVTVQTVATKKNANDLVALGDKLYRLGVKSWRIFKVAPSKASIDGYTALVGSYTDAGKKIIGKRAKGPYEFVFKKVLDAHRTNWQKAMAVQITQGEEPNAVILVGPDGRFYTESNITLGKILLNEEKPTNPTLESIKSKVNMSAHARRYLNLTSH